jgi:hypothetical protein
VAQEWLKRKGADEEIQRFKIPLHLPDGRIVTATIPLIESMSWAIHQLCKSGEMAMPDGEEGGFVVTPDDIEMGVFYFAVSHTELDNGRKVVNVRFHSKEYAIRQNPELADVTFPNTRPPITLRPAPVVEEQPPEPDEPGKDAA